MTASVPTMMGEIGIDLSQESPKPLTDEVERAADVVVTMGCGDACPIYPGKRYLDWELPDPAGKSLHEVRAIRDEIDRHVQTLVNELAPADSRTWPVEAWLKGRQPKYAGHRHREL